MKICKYTTMRLWPKYKKNKTMTLSSNEFPSFLSQSFQSYFIFKVKYICTCQHFTCVLIQTVIPNILTHFVVFFFLQMGYIQYE